MESRSTDLRLVALFEAGKGILVFATACTIFEFIHTDVQEAAEQLVRHFHLNQPAITPGFFWSSPPTLTIPACLR